MIMVVVSSCNSGSSRIGRSFLVGFGVMSFMVFLEVYVMYVWGSFLGVVRKFWIIFVKKMMILIFEDWVLKISN